MSGDELVVLVTSVAVAAIVWSWWYRAVLVRTLVIRNASRFIFIVGPPACFLLLYLVLRGWAAEDVRDSWIYLLFYMAAGVAWVGVGAQLCCFLGLSARDDIIERQNLAAAFATAGALVGITFCFTGANVGNGPGWWVVVFSAALSTVAFFVIWALVERLTGISESVTIERAGGAGLRLGGFLAGTGMILGRAVAGDWVSTEATVRDFVVVAGPVLPLAATAIIVERIWPFDTNARTEETVAGLLLAGAYVAAAFLYVFIWQGAP